MRLSFSDYEIIPAATIKREIKRLTAYRKDVAQVVISHDITRPEYSLVHASDASLHDTRMHLPHQDE